MRTASVVLALLLLGALPAIAQEIPEDGLFIRVVDAVAGLCCVIRVPAEDPDEEPHWMVYDAGHWSGKGWMAMHRIREIVPDTAPIEFMVLSHSDGDHQGAVAGICAEYDVREVLRAGYPRGSATWERANQAILDEAASWGCFDYNLQLYESPVGESYSFGAATLSVASGFHEPPPKWGVPAGSEYRNAASIVIRIEYEGRSVLLCGDAVGRHIGDPVDRCIAAEEYMVDRVADVPLASDVIVAPHHGADNGSARCLIRATAPTHVVFSAGHAYEHPRSATAQRYLDESVLAENIFRTDRGDDEGGDEWDEGALSGHLDRPGDDDIDIWLGPAGELTVGYRFTALQTAGFQEETISVPDTFPFRVRYRPPPVPADPAAGPAAGHSGGTLTVGPAPPELPLEEPESAGPVPPPDLALDVRLGRYAAAFGPTLRLLEQHIREKRPYHFCNVTNLKCAMQGVWRELACDPTVPHDQARLAAAAQVELGIRGLECPRDFREAHAALRRAFTGLALLSLPKTRASSPRPLLASQRTFPRR